MTVTSVDFQEKIEDGSLLNDVSHSVKGTAYLAAGVALATFAVIASVATAVGVGFAIEGRNPVSQKIHSVFRGGLLGELAAFGLTIGGMIGGVGLSVALSLNALRAAKVCCLNAGAHYKALFR